MDEQNDGPRGDGGPLASEVRRQFLDFFTAREHQEVPSGPVFPQDDPTLLFTNAGMNQFKDVFLGTGKRAYKRAVDTQKCIRVSGKHNDLEQVGVDTYHHTFFEMLGNWSFGDYFKKEAILWAWELLTEVYGLAPERLWVTVFAGDEKEGLGADAEARRIWIEEAGVPAERVLDFDRRDNFWEMGETGPCGPCSEIHYDRGGPDEDPADGADPAIGVNAGNERFIEIWNLVFMEFNRRDDGTLLPLPAPCVDTGLGFERLLSILQGKDSNYDTDLFTPIFDALSDVVGRKYGGGDGEEDVAFRVIADHVRATCSAFADGALPSNEGRGYVMRRLIRRAARFGRQALGLSEPFLYRLAPAVGETLGDAFPEIPARMDHIQLLLKAEEESFRKTLDRGLVLFGDLAQRMEGGGVQTISGEEAFELYSTYGFPRDLVELMARERGLTVDGAGWDRAEAAHRSVSRSEGSFQQILSAEQLSTLSPTQSTCHDDLGENLQTSSRVQALFPGDGSQGPDRLVLDSSPFYPEGGGQVGDRGVIEGENFRFDVRNTRRMGEVIIHLGSASGTAAPGEDVRAQVDDVARAATQRNHTATHLLHAALRQVLGEHVTQQGSYVGPDRLRFDLSHPRGISAEELEAIEALVNEQIMANGAVATTVESPEAARSRGVMALFGEKYGELARVVDVGGWSLELCGGTHVAKVGDIGPFLLQSERAIQAGVRRVEGLTGPAALEFMQGQRRLLREASQSLKTAPEGLTARIGQMQQQLKEARRAQAQSSGADVDGAFARVKADLTGEGLRTGVFDLPDLDGQAIRELGDRVASLKGDLAVGLFGRDGEKVPFFILCLGAAAEAGLRAGDLARELSPILGGGGGGRPDKAQGQGLRADSVSEAVEALRGRLESALTA
jgi:alanyl-tRNA synthetase